MNSAGPGRFKLRGEFVGFRRTPAGKRRLAMRTKEGEEWPLKVPKPLRREMEGSVGVGSLIEVMGEARGKVAQGALKRTVTRWRVIVGKPVQPPACLGCKIRVCTKANCWERGGRELWQELKEQLTEAGLAERVELKGVRCMGRCKKAPNLEFRGKHYERCPRSKGAAIVEQIVAESARPER